ncbi:MAG TPA: helix-turn-helix transcriptional regulator [Gaiellaceae bacterium]|jgi:transcriptional regulator with XRE-family HTH domain
MIDEMAETRSPAHLAYGLAFRQVRGERGISQERLADLAGLDRTYVSGIERGERNPSLANLLKLATTLEVALREVATRADVIAEAGGAPNTALSQPATNRHPISYALERSAIGLKGLNEIAEPISAEAASDILYDAARLIAELLETLLHYEEQTGQDTGVTDELEGVQARLEGRFPAHPHGGRGSGEAQDDLAG